MDKISEGQVEHIQIKTELEDDKSIVCFYKESDSNVNIVKLAPSPAADEASTEVNAEDIKSEITLGEFECVASSMPSTAVIKLRNIEELQKKSHQVKDITRKRFECEICKKQFDQKASFNRHLKVHTVPYKVLDEGFPCKICKKKFYHETTVNKHMLLIHDVPLGEKELSCKICGREFKRRTHLRYHMQVHSDEKPVICDMCGQSFRWKSSLTNHMRAHFDERPWKCQYQDCGKSFIQKVSLDTHIVSIHTGEKRFQCDECDAKYTTKSKLNLHKQGLSGLRPYACDICEKDGKKKAFKSKENLAYHKRIHSDVKPYGCDECGARILRKETLTTHKISHTGEKRFSCGKCESRFASATSLKNHQVKHTGAKPFVCEDCGKSFGYKVALNKHKLTHTGDKKYHCTVCGKSFGYKHSLQGHILTHTGEKPFACDMCSSRFATKAFLNQHHQSHNTVKAFGCDLCASKFGTKKLLNQHKRSHNTEKPFGCDLCTSKFGTKSLLNQHKSIHNKNTTTKATTYDVSSQAPQALPKIMGPQTSTVRDTKSRVIYQKFPENIDPPTIVESFVGIDLGIPFDEGQPEESEIMTEKIISFQEDDIKREKTLPCVKMQPRIISDQVHELPIENQGIQAHINENSGIKKRKSVRVAEKILQERSEFGNEFKAKTDPLTIVAAANTTLNADEMKTEITLDECVPSSNGSVNQFQCEICKKIFDRELSLTKHLKVHAKPFKVLHEGFPCKICKKKFYHEATVNKHMLLIHDVPLVEKELSCKICGKEFKKRTHLRSHQKVHSDEKPVMCDICGQSFRSKMGLRFHMYKHTNEKPWKCQYQDCGKSFIQKVSLDTHIVSVHTGEKRFQCDECDAKFTTKQRLDRHKLGHSGLRPYVCDICEKNEKKNSFRSKAQLAQHKRLHSDIKPYGCDECGARFFRNDTLKTHKISHTGEKRFTCGICQSRFASATSLKNHQVKHTGAKPFACSDCGKSFGFKSTLRSHQLKHTTPTATASKVSSQGFEPSS